MCIFALCKSRVAFLWIQKIQRSICKRSLHLVYRLMSCGMFVSVVPTDRLPLLSVQPNMPHLIRNISTRRLPRTFSKVPGSPQIYGKRWRAFKKQAFHNGVTPTAQLYKIIQFFISTRSEHIPNEVVELYLRPFLISAPYWASDHIYFPAGRIPG
jgi:hypothetical protein